MENPIISIFDCTVCLDVPNDNVKIFQCSRGHLLCEACHSKLIDCPSCNAKLGFIRCLVAEKYLRQVSDIKINKWDDIRCEFGEMKRRHDLEIKEVQKKHELEIIKFNSQLIMLRDNMRCMWYDSTQEYYISDRKGFTQVYIAASGRLSKSAIYWGQDSEDINLKNSVSTDTTCKCLGSNETISKTRNIVKAVVHTIGMAVKLGIKKLTINVLETTPAYIRIFRYMDLAKSDRSYWIDVVDGQCSTYAHDFEMLDIILQIVKSLRVRFVGVSGDHKQMARALQFRDGDISLMTIFFRGLSGKTWVLEVKPTDTVKDVKNMIENKDGTPALNSVLLFGGKPLEESKRLSDYNIKKDSVLDVTIGVRNW